MIFKSYAAIKKHANNLDFYFPHQFYRDDPKWLWDLGDVYDPSLEGLLKDFPDEDEDYIQWLYHERYPRYVTYFKRRLTIYKR